ncbi:cation:proton antiporter [Weissella kandleri]|uniref:cation:proton antiporter n=1 Tax=Weissella kandleri TaxID=1616 RepID=UPI00387E6D17
MEFVEVGIGLLGVVLLGNLISHLIRGLPVSLIEIGLGVFLATVFKVQITLDTSWFLLIFVAPLLYSDAWRFPKREMWALKGPIFSNAIILVIITTLIGGYAIYALVPELSLAVSFALAAILSPTDPVAVQAIAQGTKLPERLLHLVAGESLINDASGLVIFKVALAATVTGTFSVWQATGEFFYTSLIGALIGAALAILFNTILEFIASRRIHDAFFVVVLQIFSPLMMYLVAEHFHTSGVIAVVVGAVIGNLNTKNNVNYTGEIQMVGHQTWDILGYLLNGIIFVLLGIELPVAMGAFVGVTGKLALPMLFWYAMMTWMVIFAIRVIWTYLNQWWRYYQNKDEHPDFKMAVMSGLVGVRGAVTMAGVLSIPTVLADGSTPFPARGIVLFIAATVIIISLLMALVGVPLLARQTQKSQPQKTKRVVQHMTEPRAQIYILQSAVRELEQARNIDNQNVVYAVLARYQTKIRQLQLENMNTEMLNPMLEAEVQLRQICLKAENDVLKQLLKRKQISDFVYSNEAQRIARIQDNLEQMVKRHGYLKFGARLQHLILVMFRAIRIWMTDEDDQTIRRQMKRAQQAENEAGLAAAKKYVEAQPKKYLQRNQQVVHNVMVAYEYNLQMVQVSWSKRDQKAQQEQLIVEMAGLTAQREAIQHLLDAHFISFQMALQLRQTINYTEAGLLADEIR